MKKAPKVITAAIAIITAMPGSVFPACTAMADEFVYWPTINANGVTYDAQTGILSVPINAAGATADGYDHVSVRYDSHQITDIVFAATMNTFAYLGTVDADDVRLGLKLTNESKEDATSVRIQIFMPKTKVDDYDELSASDHTTVLAVDADGNEDSYLTHTVPAVGTISSSRTATPMPPYIRVAPVLIVTAGAVAVFVILRQDRRRRRR